MSNNQWVQESTPHDNEWIEPDDYGTPLDQPEWDDHAAEQAEPVPMPTPVTVEVPEHTAGEDWMPRHLDPDDTVDDETGAVVETDPRHGDSPEETTDIQPADSGPDAPAESVTETAAMAGLYRADSADSAADGQQTEEETTQVRSVATPSRLADEQAEQERRDHQLRVEREARDARLGVVQTSGANAVRENTVPRRRGVGPFGSTGLFVLRVVVATVLGVFAYQILSDVDATAGFLSTTLLPQPRPLAWILGFGLATMAVFLLIGLAVRTVGLVMVAVGIVSLGFARWGQFSPFVQGVEGFIGDKDLLLTAIGFLFVTLGGGRAGIDGAISSSRAKAREAKSS